MPVDFSLSASEAQVQKTAAGFAQNVLKPARAEYVQLAEQHERFQATRPAYETAVQGGMVKGLVSSALDGGSGSLVEAAILVEECYAVEPSAAITIFATGLGLTPLNFLQKPEFNDFLTPFLKTEGAPQASLVFSEPGGVANYLEKGAPGLNTTAYRDGGDWVLNGEKVWATNCAGWDLRGAELSCVVCRDVTDEPGPDAKPEDSVMILLVTREDIQRNGEESFQVLRHLSTPGHISTSGPHVKYTNLRVPSRNLLCPPGTGAAIAFASFDFSAVLVGAMAVGLLRAAFDAALAFAKSDNRRGAVPLLERQAFADLLSGVKMQTEACRALTWKAAWCLEKGEGTYESRREVVLGAKVFCSEAAVKGVMDAINAVGITAYDKDQPFTDLLNCAMALPIFDGGNVGIRRRHLQQLMMSETYDPWAATYGPSQG